MAALVTADLEPNGVEAARLDLLSAGYCVACNRIVVRDEEGACPAGHDARLVSGRIALSPNEEPPHLPRFSIAAFLVPPVWGPAHGQWAGAIFLPMWLFMDSVIASSQGRGAGLSAGAVFVTVATFGMQAWFASRANGIAWRRVADRVTVSEYLRRERTWIAAMIPLALLLYGWGLYYRLVLAG